MRDLFLDFGTFTVRIVETVPGEPGEEADSPLDDSYDVIETPGEPWPGYAVSDLGQYHATGRLPQTVEVVDADTLPSTDEREADRQAILAQELTARIETVKTKLVTASHIHARFCRHCQERYFFDTDDYVFTHSEYPVQPPQHQHKVIPAADDAENAVILASLQDMLNDL